MDSEIGTPGAVADPATPAPVQHSGLGRRASRGAAVTMAGQLTRVLAQAASVIVLARLLTPGDFGLTAIVVTIVGVGELLRDFGLSRAAVQSRELSSAERDNLWWVNVGVGVVLAVVLVLTAPGIAAVYHQPAVTDICWAMSAVFVLNGMGAQYLANLQRDLRFVAITTIDLTALVAGVLVAIVLAVGGAGYWAIVAQQLTFAGVSLVASVVVGRWWPRWYRRGVSIRRFLAFGASLFVSQVITYASRNVDSLVIGLRFGTVPLGLYNRAFQLLTLPIVQLNAPATRVAAPVLAKLQDDDKRFGEFLVTGQTILLHPVLFVLAAMGATAGPFVDFLLGSDWAASVPLFRILAVAGAFQAAGYVAFWIYLGKGLTRANLVQNLIARPLMIAAVVVGAFWGVEGVAWGFAVGTAINWPIPLYIAGRAAGIPVLPLAWNGCRCLLGYGVAAVAGYYVVEALGGADVVRVVVGTLTVAAVTVLFALVWPRFRRDFGLIRRAGTLLRGSRPAPAAAHS